MSKNNDADSWLMSQGYIIERKCPTCENDHKTIVYRRLTAPQGINFKNLFLDIWEAHPNGKNKDTGKFEKYRNEMHKDFALYSNVEDAKVQTTLQYVSIAHHLKTRVE